MSKYQRQSGENICQTYNKQKANFLDMQNYL